MQRGHTMFAASWCARVRHGELVTPDSLSHLETMRRRARSASTPGINNGVAVRYALLFHCIRDGQPQTQLNLLF